MKTFSLLLLLPLSAFSFAADPEPIVSSQTIKGSVQDIWKAFTTKQGQESWMVAKSEIDLKVGGLMRTHYSKDGKIGDEGTIENLIASYDPERMLSMKIAKAPASFPWKKAAQATWTVVYFEPISAIAVLRSPVPRPRQESPPGTADTGVRRAGDGGARAPRAARRCPRRRCRDAAPRAGCCRAASR